MSLLEIIQIIQNTESRAQRKHARNTQSCLWKVCKHEYIYCLTLFPKFNIAAHLAALLVRREKSVRIKHAQKTAPY
jgi:hypothetical protein